MTDAVECRRRHRAALRAEMHMIVLRTRRRRDSYHNRALLADAHADLASELWNVEQLIGPPKPPSRR
jgi:hypothetical protein